MNSFDLLFAALLFITSTNGVIIVGTAFILFMTCKAYHRETTRVNGEKNV